MSSFFTLPASTKKRKRNETAPDSSKPLRPSRSALKAGGAVTSGTKRARRDASLSGSDSDVSAISDDPSDASDASSDGHAGETGAERRLRLAERYLEHVRGEVEQTAGFDAEEIDRDLIAERLRDDAAASKGKMYRFVAQKYRYARATRTHFRMATECVTGVAVCAPYVYTVSKDRQLVKWELSTPSTRSKKFHGPPVRQRPTKVLSTRGDRHQSADKSYKHHVAPIFCVAASPDNRFIATGGQDKRLIMWSATDLSALRVFSQHRDSITALAIQPGLNRLYSASYDRTIKTWGLNEQAYVETLFGHQDHVVDIAALGSGQERCLSAGARDRTVRLWKVVDETQLVFRGGGGRSSDKTSSKDDGSAKRRPEPEGRIERVVSLDDETFVTGSDNGSLALWSVHKKKPVFVVPRAHGLDPALKPEEAFAERDLTGRVPPAPPQPRWITALAAVPGSDVMASGSWDGTVRVWRVSEDKRRIEAAGVIGQASEDDVASGVSSIKEPASTNGVEEKDEAASTNGAVSSATSGEDTSIRGIVNDLAIFERDPRGGEVGTGLCVVAALGTTHRLGRWMRSPKGQNGAVVIEVPAIGKKKTRGRGKKSGDSKEKSEGLDGDALA